MTYFVISGILVNIVLLVLLLLCLWVWFVIPFIEAISMYRWYSAIAKAWPHSVKMKPRCRVFFSHYEIFGRNWTSTRNKYGEWRGVGDWEVYGYDDE